VHFWFSWSRIHPPSQLQVIFPPNAKNWILSINFDRKQSKIPSLG
jgi:hypothetical protein